MTNHGAMVVPLVSQRPPARNTRSGVHTLEMEDVDPLGGLRLEIEEWITRGMLQVPPLSGTATELHTLASNPNASLDDALTIIQREPNLAARVVRQANAAIMRAVTPVTDVRRAAMRVGISGMRDMAFALAMGQLCRASAFKQQFGDTYRRSYMVACATQWSCQTLGLDRGLGFLCGLLHDLGMIALLATLGSTKEGAAAAREPLHLERLLDDLHPKAGEYIITNWKLPVAVAEVARWHHEPSKYSTSPMILLVAALTHAAEVTGSTNERVDAYSSMPLLFQAGLGREHLAALAQVMTQASEDELVKMLSR